MDVDRERKRVEAMAIGGGARSKSAKLVELLRRFLSIQQRRAETYAKLRRGFLEYMIDKAELAYQQLCGEITVEFNDCSKQVIEMEALLAHSDLSRGDLSSLLKSIQAQEKQKLYLTAQIQLLKKAGRPSERLVSHVNCKFNNMNVHECSHLNEITEEVGTEDAGADAEYTSALNEAIKGVQETVMIINDHLEEVRYEIEALELE